MKERLSGGFLAEVWRDGETVTKTYADDGLAPAEVAGLRWLSVPDGPPVPSVLRSGGRLLTLPYVTPGRASAASAAAFGEALGRLHQHVAPAWGWAPSEMLFVGRLRVEVGEHPTHEALWRARVASLLDRLPGVDRRPFEEADLSAVPECGPRRVHGDLWSGNVLWASDGVGWLIDPAAHGGHPELDVGLLALFGAPHLEPLLAGWERTAAPGPGWRERLPLHQVPTLLFHAHAFGGGYLQQALRAVGA